MRDETSVTKDDFRGIVCATMTEMLKQLLAGFTYQGARGALSISMDNRRQSVKGSCESRRVMRRVS